MTTAEKAAYIAAKPIPRHRDGSADLADLLRKLDNMDDAGWARPVTYWARRIAFSGWEYGARTFISYRVREPLTVAEFTAFTAYCARVTRFATWMKEDRHNWIKDESSRIHWADNSIEVEEVSRLTGERRRVQETAPHGDLCF